MSKKSDKHFVFVYGTLRPPDKEATHHLPGFDMFDAGKFPYIVPSQSGFPSVYGNLLEVNRAELAYLDRIEGVDHGLYLRNEVYVHDIDSGIVCKAWAYVGGPLLLPKPIPSGDWTKR